MDSSGTEVWFRNPQGYIRECLELGVLNTIWDFGYLLKKRMELHRFAEVYYPASMDWTMLAVGSRLQGAYEIQSGYDLSKPKRIHPVWEYGTNMDHLISLLEEERERVVIAELPSSATTMGRAFFRTLGEIQEEYPNTKIHVHGVYSYRTMFGLGFRAADVDPRTDAKKGWVFLPSGKRVSFEKAAETPEWITLLGFRPSDLKIPAERCKYNMKSALWAGKYFREAIPFEAKRRVKGKIDSESADPSPVLSKKVFFQSVKPNAGDKFLCNVCSLQLSCKYFREGAVCVVPDSEPTELARFFKTRDSDTIIEGLGTLLAAETRRLKIGLEDEEADGRLNPEVTKIVNTLFDRGVKLAKLVDPKLAAASGPQVQINQQTINASTPQALMASIVAELEARGIPRSQITPDMVRELLALPEDKRNRAIEAKAIEASDGL